MKYAGRDFLLQILDGSTWLSSLSDRSTSISIGNEQVDTTSKDATPWRELSAFGVRSADISCSGLWTDRRVASVILSAAFDQSLVSARVISGPSGDVIVEGTYLIGSVERTGEYNGAEQYSISMSSSDTPDMILPYSGVLATEGGMALTTEDGLLLTIG